MNYKLINDEKELIKFIDRLPECGPTEMFYISLFSRKKYEVDTSGLTADKNQLARTTASKDRIVQKIRQMEVAYGAYTKPDGTPIEQETLAVYISPNPRCLHKASLNYAKDMMSRLAQNQPVGNPRAKSMNAIQNSCNNKVYFDVDIDEKDYGLVEDVINFTGDADNIIVETRGGYHVLVNTSTIPDRPKKTWYQAVHTLLRNNTLGELNGDGLVPVPGTMQGGFSPKLIK